MSLEALTAALYCSNAKAAARLILIMIADSIDRNRECMTASMAEIAEMSTYKERFTRKQVYKLLELGELIEQQIPGKKSNYYIPLLPGEEGYAPEECSETRHVCNGWHTPLNVQRSAYAKKKRQERKKQAPQRPVKGVHDSAAHPGTIAHPMLNPGTIAPPPRHDSAAHPGTIAPPPRHDSAGVYSNIPILSLNNPIVSDAHVRAREDSPSLSKKMEGEKSREQEAPPAVPLSENPPLPAPPPPMPDVPEARALWWEVKQRCILLPQVGVIKVEPWTNCHLYKIGTGYYQLRLGRGHDPVIFRQRFESYIRESIVALTRQGNVVVDIVKPEYGSAISAAS